MNTTEILFSLIRSELCGAPVNADVTESINEEMLMHLYQLSDAHDIAHIVASALSKVKVLGSDEASEKFNKKLLLSVYRYEQINYEIIRICKALEGAKIQFVPLKGAVIRRYYPEPWMRTSCDIDILVRETDIETVVCILKGELGYTSDDKRHYHDISLHSETGVHLELHFSIKENNEVIDRVLERVWENVVPVDDKKCHHALTKEYFLFYIVAHIAHHFLDGGCGIRPILDVWLMRRNMDADESLLEEMLSEARLTEFFKEVKELSDAWLSSGKHSDITKEMEDFILNAGVYGTLENRVGIAKVGKKGFQYALQRIFMPYSKLKLTYPILGKYPVLYPYYQLVRWKRILFKNSGKAISELKYNASINDDKVLKFEEICKKLELL